MRCRDRVFAGKNGKERGSVVAEPRPVTQGVFADGTIATIRSGPPLPPLIFIGSAMTKLPVAGRRSRLATFSKAGNVLTHENPVGIVRRRLAVVDARRVDAHGLDPALPGQPPGGGRVDAWEMQLRHARRSGLGGAQVARLVGPAARPSGAHQHDRVPSGIRPCCLSHASQRRHVQEIVGSASACATTSTTTAGPISRSSGIWSVVYLPSAKWIGASRWVPPCSAVEKLLAA